MARSVSASRTSQILDYLYAHPELPISLDTETGGLNVHDKRDRCIGISIAFRHIETGKKVSDYWPVLHRAGREENIDKATAAKIRWVLEKQNRTLIFANEQFDILSLETLGIHVADNPFYDVLTMMNLINENWTRGRRGLDELAVFLDCGKKITTWEWEDEFKLSVEKKTGWPNTTPSMMYEYACVDAEVTFDIWEELMQHPNWLELPDDIWGYKQRVIRTLIEMRRRGIELDLELTKQLEIEGEAAKEAVKAQLGLNPASHNDMVELFINRLGLPVLKRSEKTGEPSFDKSVMPDYELMLERIDNTDAKYIRVYRGWQTAVGLLLKPYQNFVSPDGRLRTSYTTHVTATGRLSSREPNLQQISKDGGAPWNDRVKKCFRAREGYTLLSADYSQLELRLAVAYSQEPALLEIFEEGRDVFTEMAEEMGWPRQRVKTFVYSIQYGGGVNRIMSAFGVSKKEAEKLRRDFYRRYPRFRALDELCKGRVKESKRLRIWSGRYRHFQYESQAYKGMNSLIQGGAADIVERVMVHMMENVDSPDCQMLLQVHDALVFEVKNELVDHYRPLIQREMEAINRICSGDDYDEFNPLFPVKFAVEVTEW